VKIRMKKKLKQIHRNSKDKTEERADKKQIRREKKQHKLLGAI